MTRYSARFEGVTLLEKSKAQTVSVSIERSGSAPSITSATFSLMNPAGEAIVDSQTASVAGGVVSYSLGASVLNDEEFGLRWLVLFDVIIGGVTYSFYNDAAICKTQIYPPITPTDLSDRHGDLSNLLPTGVTSTQAYIDAAWIELTSWLYSEAVPFWTLRTVSALREPLIFGALALCFRDFSTLLDSADRYTELAEMYETRKHKARQRLRGYFDRGEDDSVSSSQSPGSSVIMLSARRRRI
jgi:hypothetical protein